MNIRLRSITLLNSSFRQSQLLDIKNPLITHEDRYCPLFIYFKDPVDRQDPVGLYGPYVFTSKDKLLSPFLTSSFFPLSFS